MYQYEYVEVKSKGHLVIKNKEHREIIKKYSENGWRFISMIPTEYNASGVVYSADLIFEKNTNYEGV